MCELHWLPVRYRVIMTLVYKALKGEAPHYITDKLKWKQTDHRYHTHANCETHVLEVPKVKKKTHAARSFSVMGPELWNTLLINTRRAVSLPAFKKRLKYRSIKDNLSSLYCDTHIIIICWGLGGCVHPKNEKCWDLGGCVHPKNKKVSAYHYTHPH